MLRIKAVFFEKILRNWPKRPVWIVVWVEGEIRGYGRGQESGKQCKAVPTLRKQADSVYTEPACFMLVGALPLTSRGQFSRRRKLPEKQSGYLFALLATFSPVLRSDASCASLHK